MTAQNDFLTAPPPPPRHIHRHRPPPGDRQLLVLMMTGLLVGIIVGASAYRWAAQRTPRTPSPIAMTCWSAPGAQQEPYRPAKFTPAAPFAYCLGELR